MTGQISSILAELLVVDERVGKLAIERSPVGNAAAHELRPRRNRDVRIDGFGQQAPKLGVEPAKIMSRSVAMLTDTRAQPFHFRDQRIPVHVLKIFIHSMLLARQWHEVQP